MKSCPQHSELGDLGGAVRTLSPWAPSWLLLVPWGTPRHRAGAQGPAASPSLPSQGPHAGLHQNVSLLIKRAGAALSPGP